MKKRVFRISALLVSMSLLTACSGASQPAQNPASKEESTAMTAPASAAPEMIDGLEKAQRMQGVRIGEELYDALAPLTDDFIAAGTKTGRQDENGNDVLEYRVLDREGQIVDTPVFVGYQSYVDDDWFVITVEENGAKYDILCSVEWKTVNDRDVCTVIEEYSTRDDADGYHTIASFSNGVIHLKKTLEPDASGNRFSSHKYAPLYGQNELGSILCEIDGAAFAIRDMSPWAQEWLMASSYCRFSNIPEGGWVNYFNIKKSIVNPIHIGDAHWFYAYPYAPNDGWVLLQRFAEEENENGSHDAAELMLYNVKTEESVAFTEYCGWGTSRLGDGTRHPVSREGLIMLCETNQEPHRHAVYNVKTKEYVLTLEDGYGSVGLDDRQEDVFQWTLVSNEDRSKWTWLNGEFEQVNGWFEDACAFRNSYAVVKASDGKLYGVRTFKDDMDVPVIQICTEAFEGDGVTALGYWSPFALKEGDQYRLLWIGD